LFMSSQLAQMAEDTAMTIGETNPLVVGCNANLVSAGLEFKF